MLSSRSDRRGSWGGADFRLAVASGQKHHFRIASEARMRQLWGLIGLAGRLLSRLRIPQAVIRLEAATAIQTEGARAYEVAEEQARLCLRVSSVSGFRFWSRVAAEIARQVAETARHKEPALIRRRRKPFRQRACGAPHPPAPPGGTGGGPE